MSGERASLSERRWPLSPLLEIRLYEDRLEAWNGAVLERRIPLDSVREVRMAVEPAGQQRVVVCRVTGPGGEIAFSSLRAENGGWVDNLRDFQRVLVALHKGLLPQAGEIAFVEGQSLKFRLIMSGAGAVLFAAALSYCVYMLLVEGAAMLALAGAPFALVGAALAVVFRPGRPIPYDPAKLVERFGG
ncbi:MAG: hypothetical protein ACFE0P_07970 [Oceanicaulis sp.]